MLVPTCGDDLLVPAEHEEGASEDIDAEAEAVRLGLDDSAGRIPVEHGQRAGAGCRTDGGQGAVAHRQGFLRQRLRRQPGVTGQTEEPIHDVQGAAVLSDDARPDSPECDLDVDIETQKIPQEHADDVDPLRYERIGNFDPETHRKGRGRRGDPPDPGIETAASFTPPRPAMTGRAGYHDTASDSVPCGRFRLACTRPLQYERGSAVPLSRSPALCLSEAGSSPSSLGLRRPRMVTP